MHKLKGISILLMVFILRGGKGWCTLQKKTQYDVYLDCLGDMANLDTEARRLESGYSDIHEEWSNRWRIFLNISNANIDNTRVDWESNYNVRIIGITFNNMDRIPEKINEFENLETLAIINLHARELNWYILCKLRHLIQVNLTHGHIEIINFELRQEKSNVEIIDLSYNLIQALPNNCFPNFSQLKKLNLSHNLIQSIDTHSFEELTLLEILDMSYNRLIRIEHSFASLVNLKKLYLNNNNLISINGPDLRSITKIETLNIASNQLKVIEDDAFRVHLNLEELDLSNNKLTNINKVLFWSNLKLHRLLLTNNDICAIESEAFKMKNISSFEFDGNKLKGAITKRTFEGIFTDVLNLSGGLISSLEPEAFSGLQVRVLNVSTNILTTISATSFKSTPVIYLDLSNNNISIIDFESEDMKNLVLFTARNNTITKVSKSTLINFVSLLTLDLSHNKISELEPESFSEMKTLQFLDLSHNLLANSLKANLFLGLSYVTNIQLQRNRFTSIDNNTFSRLKSLKVLNCAYGEISFIGYDSFKGTGSLEILDLSHNMLNDFIVNHADISLVKELYLNDNYIRNITADMFLGLSCLEKINLANNNVMNLDTKSFNSLKSLKTLDLSSITEVEIEDILVKTMYHLTELKLANIKKQFSFENIVNKSISRLDISHNDIVNINAILVFKINDLEYLNLGANKITFIDKYSFQSMPVLKELDLSCNSIDFIQPGSFLHVNNIQTLNLHNNYLPALQFGVLDGLYDLETLNISNNAIHKFERTLLLNTPKISTIALDNNVIEQIKFDDFYTTRMKLITVGGNPISCHTLSNFLNRYERNFDVTAVNLDYHNENVNGISCLSNSIPKQNYLFSQNDPLANETSSFWLLNKAIENVHDSIVNFQAAIDKINLKNKSEENRISGSLTKGYVKSEAQTNNINKINYLIGILYFVAICLSFLIVFHISKYIIVFWKSKVIAQKKTMNLGSTHQMVNILELQDG